MNQTLSHDTAWNSILRKQTDPLVKQTLLLTLPPKEVKVFNGDPLEFRAFIKSYEDIMESKTDAAQDGLCFFGTA